jgi:hypothetical protein
VVKQWLKWVPAPCLRIAGAGKHIGMLTDYQTIVNKIMTKKRTIFGLP